MQWLKDPGGYVNIKTAKQSLYWHNLVDLLTHWGRMMHICISNLTIIGPDNGLSPGQRQAIIWTNAGILLIGPWGTNFSEILVGIHTFSFKKINLKMLSAKFRPFCLGLNVLIIAVLYVQYFVALHYVKIGPHCGAYNPIYSIIK